MKCQNREKINMDSGHCVIAPCEAKATRKRQSWRFGKVGEPAIVNEVVHLCNECARSWDEAKAEAAWEARVS